MAVVKSGRIVVGAIRRYAKPGTCAYGLLGLIGNGIFRTYVQRKVSRSSEYLGTGLAVFDGGNGCAFGVVVRVSSNVCG